MKPEELAAKIIPLGTYPYREDADELRQEIQATITKAVFAERERCAKLAESLAGDGQNDSDFWARALGKELAKKIRSGV